ncbi:MAG: protein-L-isoaspartate O-methyltransferase [Haloferacaceae archaeon]
MDSAVLRDDMVDGVDHAVGGLDAAVGAAMRTVPRHEFVDDRPYDNRATEHEGTTVLAPKTAARLLEALDVADGDDVLVVGAGVGYTAAVVAEIVGGRHVHAVDITRRLVLDARRNLARAGYDAVLVDRRDGARGLPEYAPFDRILVEAAAVRPPRALLDQLADGGRLAMPIGGPDQTLVAVESTDGDGRPADRDARPAAHRDARLDVPGFGVVERFGDAAFDPLLVEGEQAGGLTRNRTEREDREFAQQGYFAPAGWEQDWIDWERHG